MNVLPSVKLQEQKLCIRALSRCVQNISMATGCMLKSMGAPEQRDEGMSDASRIPILNSIQMSSIVLPSVPSRY